MEVEGRFSSGFGTEQETKNRTTVFAGGKHLRKIYSLYPKHFHQKVIKGGNKVKVGTKYMYLQLDQIFGLFALTTKGTVKCVICYLFAKKIDIR